MTLSPTVVLEADRKPSAPGFLRGVSTSRYRIKGAGYVQLIKAEAAEVAT